MGNSIIIYETIYNGNSTKIAKRMAQTLGCKYISTDEAKTLDLRKYELIGFGSGIYFGMHHPKLFEIVEKLNYEIQDVFIFSSRGNPKLGKYHEKLRRSLISKGKNILGEFSCRGYDETGPWLIFGGGNIGKPNEKDLRKASRFIEKAMPQYCVKDYYKSLKKTYPVSEGLINEYVVKTYKEDYLLKGDLVTVNQNLCKGCGKCKDICPMNVISLEEGKAYPKKELDCIICRLCVSTCPERAISLHFRNIDAIKVALRHKDKKSL